MQLPAAEHLQQQFLLFQVKSKSNLIPKAAKKESKCTVCHLVRFLSVLLCRDIKIERWLFQLHPNSHTATNAKSKEEKTV